MTPAVSVQGLGKAYRHHPTRLDKLARFASFGWLGRESLAWVLRGVSFEIEAGETVGIVGRNGAGKSTLLKLIAGVTQATEGSIALTGRVAALLELGTGFHPDLTGRQNVAIAGSLLGLSKAEIGGLMPAIEAFAEIGDYIEQPLRVYSSGMQVRLAFSVATALRPEILIVDEALSVGDIYFQQKCFERIIGFREEGTTIIFVTHDLASLYRLCTRALYLDHGSLRMDDRPKSVIDLYQATMVAAAPRRVPGLKVAERPGDAGRIAAGGSDAEGAADNSPLQGDEPASGSASGAPGAAAGLRLETGSYSSPGVEVRTVCLRAENGEESTVFVSTQSMAIEVLVHFAIELADPHVGFQIRDHRGQALFMTTTYGLGASIGRVGAGERRCVRFELKPMLTPAQYTVTVGVANGARLDGSFEQSHVRHQDVAAFWVVDPVDAKRWAGITNLDPGVSIARPDDGSNSPPAPDERGSPMATAN